MRHLSLRLVVVVSFLVGCGGHDTSSVDTDVGVTPTDTDLVSDSDDGGTAPDTDVPDVDTDPGDSDAVDAGRPICFEPDLPQDWPATWADLVARAETECVETFRCDAGVRTSAQAWILRLFNTGWIFDYDAEGSLFAGLEVWHQSSCDHWFGEVAAPCGAFVASRMGSAGCARPRTGELPSPGSFASDLPLSQFTDDAYDPATIGDATCVGTATCAVGDRTLTLVWRTSMGSGHVEAWDGGVRVAATTPSATTVPAWVGEDLSACAGLTFTPSAACGVVDGPP